MRNNDTQYEAMASYFKSMLTPVSAQEIRENLTDKLSSSGMVAEGVTRERNEDVPAVQTAESAAAQAPETLPEVQDIADASAETEKSAVTDSSAGEQDFNVPENTDSSVSAAQDESETAAVSGDADSCREETAVQNADAVEAAEQQQAADSEEPVSETSDAVQQDSAVQNAEITEPAVPAGQKDQTVSVENPETEWKSEKSEANPSSAEGKDENRFEFSSSYTPKENDSFIDRDVIHSTFDAPPPNVIEAKLQSEIKTVREPQIQIQSAKQPEVRPVLEPRQETMAKLSRLIGQVKPETKVETKTEVKTEVVTITAPRVRNFAAARALEETASDVKTEVKTEQKTVTAPPAPAVEKAWANIETADEFQALFFVVDRVTFAVPLVDLGTINNIDKITALFGKPNWFMGMMNVRDEKIQVVDFAKWAMPQIAVDPEKFQYVIELGASKWGITCTELIGTQTLKRNQVQWRSNSGKRPWLAGIVKEKMCALIHVTELVKLFKKGVDIDGN